MYRRRNDESVGSRYMYVCIFFTSDSNPRAPKAPQHQHQYKHSPRRYGPLANVACSLVCSFSTASLAFSAAFWAESMTDPQPFLRSASILSPLGPAPWGVV